MAGSFEWLGINEFTAALARVGDRVAAEMRAAVAEIAADVEKAAKQGASGRPGPEVVTGTLRRSITHDPITPWGLGGWQTRIGPTVIYGRRIELGFHGTDSRGRQYNQPGYPYFSPAWRSAASRMAEIYAKHYRAAIIR